MSDNTHDLERALVFLEKAEEALAHAATALRETGDGDLIDSAIGLEAETCILSVHVQRAMRRSRRLQRVPALAS
jgi:hypothetical protein